MHHIPSKILFQYLGGNKRKFARSPRGKETSQEGKFYLLYNSSGSVKFFRFHTSEGPIQVLLWIWATQEAHFKYWNITNLLQWLPVRGHYKLLRVQRLHIGGTEQRFRINGWLRLICSRKGSRALHKLIMIRGEMTFKSLAAFIQTSPVPCHEPVGQLK